MTINVAGQVDTSGIVDGTPINAADVTAPFDDVVGIINNLGNGAQDVEALRFDELAGNPTTPAAGRWKLFTLATGLHLMDDAGVVTGPLGEAGVSDAADVTYTPAVLANWTGAADPGNTDDALDQLADRVSVVEGGGGGGGAPDNATYITQTPSAGLSAEQALSSLATGILRNTTGTGVLSIAVGADLPSHTHAAGDITSGQLPIAQGGTGASSAAGAFGNINPMTTEGDMIRRGALGAQRFAIGTAGQVLTVVGGLPQWADAANPGVIVLQHEESNNTNGGTFTSGAWQTRPLNVEVADAGNHATLAANQVTLGAGTYEIYATGVVYLVNNHQMRWQNITDATTTVWGQNGRSGNATGTNTTSTLYGLFTIAASTVFELQHRCSTTVTTNGFGQANNFGNTEVYATVMLRRLL